MFDLHDVARCPGRDGKAVADFRASRFRQSLLAGVAAGALLLAATPTIAAQIISRAAGGNYGDSSTWKKGVDAPTASDDVIISTSNSVTLQGSELAAHDLSLTSGTLTGDGDNPGTVSVYTFEISGGVLDGNAVVDFTHSATIEGGTVNGTVRASLDADPADGDGMVTQSDGTVAGSVDAIGYLFQSGVIDGSTGGKVTATTVSQSGGEMNGVVAATSYNLEGGAINSTAGGTVTASTFTQTGGQIIGNGPDVISVIATTYVQSGGNIDSWSQIDTGTYRFTGDASTGMDGNINASDLYEFDPTEDVTLGGHLNGAGKLIKSGDATLTFSGDGNGYAGDIEVKGGTLAYMEGGPPRTGDLVVDAGAVFDSIGGPDTNFRADMTGDGTFEVSGGSQFGVGGSHIDMGALLVTNGAFRVGTSYFDAGDDTGTGSSSEAHFGTVTLAGSGGTIAVEHGSTLSVGEFTLTDGTLQDAHADDPDIANSPAIVSATTFSQSGGYVGRVALEVGSFDYSGGELAADVSFTDWFKLSGDNTVSSDIHLTGQGVSAGIEQDDGTMAARISGIETYVQSGGEMDSDLVDLTRYTQLGGTIVGTVSTDVYELAGGASDGFGNVTIHKELVQSGGSLDLDGINVPTFTQSGGTMSGTVTADTYTHSGGELDGAIAVGTYDLTNASATSTSGATIDASTAFTLEPGSGMAMVNAKLTGAGKLTKTGGGTVVLANGNNDFSGAVEIAAGTLDAVDGALPGSAAVTVADDATLQMTVGEDKTVVFNGTVTGAGGSFVKDGAGTLTLGGAVYMGGLDVAAGKLAIGTGTSTDEASFESAVIESGATVYVAKNATLTIRIPNNIINNGYLVNDGTVNDDLDNTSTFDNNAAYNANVASNTGTINNNTPGVWTGDILSNAATINNNSGAKWHGVVKGNTGSITNKAGGTWEGDVDGNTGYVTNDGTWTGKVNGNGSSGYLGTFMMIYNGTGATWNGAVVDSLASIRNVAATWNGDVLDNHADIMNDNLSNEVGIGYWHGNVVNNHKLIFNAGGGDWTGDVLGNAGYIKSDRTTDYAFNDGAGTGVAHWHGDVSANSGTIENRGLWQGDVKGNAALVENTGRWEGDVEVGNTGSIYNAEDDYNVAPPDKVRAAWIGAVKGNTGFIYNMGADWTGDVEANTGTITNSGGTFNRVAVTVSNWTGDVVSNAGKITNGADSIWTGDVLANTGTITTSGVWDGSFTNSLGGVVKARNQVNGAFSNAGTLQLTGNLSGITTLTNGGVLDLRNGTTAGQTLTVGTALLQSGSTLAVSVDTAGNTDALATGSATLGGAVQVTLNPIVGNYDYSKSYTILTGTTAGTFAGASSDLAFLDPQLSYGTPGEVTLMLVRNQQSFADIGTTPTQKATASALDALGAGNPLYDAIVGLSASDADKAFDQLSGISQSSTEVADMQAAALLSQILAGRINQAFEALGNGGDAVSNYAAGPAIVTDPTPGTGIWGQFYGGLGSTDGTVSVAGSNAATGGFAAGLDGAFGDWRLGVTVQAGTTETFVPALNASSTSLDLGAGLYGGGQLGNTRLSFGGSYTRHSVNSTRQVSFPGFDETITGSYGAGTAQAFAQAAQEVDLGAFSLTPHADVNYVANITDSYTETGGAAALSHASSFIDATFTTLGIDVKHEAAVGDDMLLTWDGGLGWRHTFAGTPSLSQSFTGGTSFVVVGAPLPTDTAVVSLGANLDLSATTTLDFNYSGQLGGGTQTHTIKASWNGRF